MLALQIDAKGLQGVGLLDSGLGAELLLLLLQRLTQLTGRRLGERSMGLIQLLDLGLLQLFAQALEGGLQGFPVLRLQLLPLVLEGPLGRSLPCGVQLGLERLQLLGLLLGELFLERFPEVDKRRRLLLRVVAL